MLEQAWAAPKPDKLDWRARKGPRRTELAEEYSITTCEPIQKSSALEVGTVKALLGEVEERVGAPEGALLVEHTAAHLRAREGRGEGEPAEQEQVEQQHWAETVKNATHLLIVVHSEAPAHYAYL